MGWWRWISRYGYDNADIYGDCDNADRDGNDRHEWELAHCAAQLCESSGVLEEIFLNFRDSIEVQSSEKGMRGLRVQREWGHFV